jgi:hypothetical protein
LPDEAGVKIDAACAWEYFESDANLDYLSSLLRSVVEMKNRRDTQAK